MIVLLGLLVALFIGYPLLNERTTSACSALAFRAIDRAGHPGDMSNPAVDSFLAGTTGYARHRMPYLPAFLTCSALYWQTAIDPNSVAKLWADLGGSELRSGSTPSVGAAQQPPATPSPAPDSPSPPPSAQAAPVYRLQGRVDINRSFNQPQGGDTDRLFGKPQGGCKNQLDQDGYRC